MNILTSFLNVHKLLSFLKTNMFHQRKTNKLSNQSWCPGNEGSVRSMEVILLMDSFHLYIWSFLHRICLPWHFDNDATSKITDVLTEHGGLLLALPLTVHLKLFYGQVGDHCETFLLFGFGLDQGGLRNKALGTGLYNK